jgi:hypothetical protein
MYYNEIFIKILKNKRTTLRKGQGHLSMKKKYSFHFDVSYFLELQSFVAWMRTFFYYFNGCLFAAVER